MSTSGDIELVPSEEDFLLETVVELPPPSEHRIFLSHGGAEMNFMEDLFLDLEHQLHHTPFFDRCPNSLSKGKVLSQYIFQAAQQCELAIVVVSEDYFSRSKWPMLELSVLVHSSKCKILPLFFGLSCKEFGDAERRKRWFQTWEAWARIDPRVSVENWQLALRELDWGNGLEFVATAGEVGFRAEVLKVVSDVLVAISGVSVCSELPKHFLPDFPFRVVNGRSDPTFAQMSEIASYFPGCTGVAYGPPYLVVSWPRKQLKPWPLTVGGMPLYYATPDHPHPPTYGRGGRSGQIMKGANEQLKPWESPSNNLIEEIARMLVAKGIGLKLFGWCGVRWYAKVVSNEDGMNMPSTICGLLVVWEIFSDLGELVRRSIIPSEHIIDNTSFQPILRPGILLESTGGFGTTSGVPLKAPNGERFFTVARHGFNSDGNQEVHHPYYMNGATVIGHVAHSNRFLGSDISLIKLRDGMTYSTISFNGEEEGDTNLRGLVSSENLILGTSLFMDSPYNGHCEGILGLRGVHVNNPIDPQHPTFSYVHINMVYFGNGMSDVKPGSCGSAMWNDQNEVASFFRWYDPIFAVAYAPSVDVLIEAGYILEAIP